MIGLLPNPQPVFYRTHLLAAYRYIDITVIEHKLLVFPQDVDHFGDVDSVNDIASVAPDKVQFL